MTTLGFVVIEYNQASKWPSIWSDDALYTIDEARQFAKDAEAGTKAIGRGETYAIARVELVEL